MWTHGFAEHVSNNKCLYLSFIIGHGVSAESQQQKWGIGHSLSSFVIKLEVLKICCLEEVSLQEMQDITQSSFSKKFQTRMTRWLLLLLISFNPFLTLSHIDFFCPSCWLRGIGRRRDAPLVRHPHFTVWEHQDDQEDSGQGLSNTKQLFPRQRWILRNERHVYALRC